MFDFLRKRKIKQYTEGARTYILRNFETVKVVQVEPPKPKEPQIRYSVKDELPAKNSQIRYSVKDEPIEDAEESQVRYSIKDESPAQESQIRYSDRESQILYSDRGGSTPEKHRTADSYDASAVLQAMRGYTAMGNPAKVMQTLSKSVNRTFVDQLLYLIDKKGLRDAQVYKAAQIDKRLFSKIVSNRQYTPSKDTVLALAFALKLTLYDANDLLSRAGYTLSHSNKRDIIIEYFFREEIYNMIDINTVLYNLEQKLIGRQ